MADLTFTVQLAQEDRARIDRLIEVLGGRINSKVEVVNKNVEVVNKNVEAPVPAPVAPFETAAAPFDTIPASAPVPEITQAQVQSRVMALCQEGPAMKAKVKAALNKYTDSVPHLKKSDYAAFMADLEALG